MSMVAAGVHDRPTITDKEFYKAMQKVKDRGTNAVPPKKSASAYILFGKEVSSRSIDGKQSRTIRVMEGYLQERRTLFC